jgi:DNA-binding Xre family transcriptional regulator
VEEWTFSLAGERHLAPSTIRGYQTDLRLFSEYVVDGRYGWSAECEKAFGPGVHPVAICHEWNTIAHLNDYEGSPEARPFTREELQRFLDYADHQVDRAVAAKRKGALAAYRDATLFKVIYGWGLRRTETSRLDVTDWGRNPAAPEFGRYGMLHVRYGKAVRGQPPRRRNVPSVMAWAVAQRGIRLSSSQVYRLVTERPERLSLKILMALLDILDCPMEDLIEPVAARTARTTKTASGEEAGVGSLRPRRARITRADS